MALTQSNPVCRNGRVLRPEFLATATGDAARDNLRDLVRINRWLGGRQILHRLLARFDQPGQPLSFLDVGAGSGDMAWMLRSRFPHWRPFSLDLHRSHLDQAPPPRIVGDAFHLPFRPRSFDVVFCSLLLHEHTDTEIPALMRNLHGLARRAFIVLDLYRHPVAYRFLPATRWLFGWTPMTLHDGPVSVKAGFHPDELKALARKAGLADVRVRRHLPWFRLSLVAPVMP